jgi:predicted enzyme related to lactoylglutathione lyase
MKHPVMWFEVLGKDSGKLCQFYGSLFGCRSAVIRPGTH